MQFYARFTLLSRIAKRRSGINMLKKRTSYRLLDADDDAGGGADADAGLKIDEKDKWRKRGKT